MTTFRERRAFLRAGVAGAAFAGGSIGPFRVFAQGAPTIRVTQFGGPFQIVANIIGKPFEATGKGKVIYEVENSVSAISKLQAQRGSPSFNVVMFSRGFAVRAGTSGLLVPLEPGDIGNLGDLSDSALTPGNFGCGMLFDCINIVYDTRKIDRPLTSWMDLWRDDLRDSIVMPSSSLPVYFIVMQIARSMGKDPMSAAGIDAAFEKLATIKPNVRTFFGDPIQATQMVERGEVKVAVQFGIRSSNIIKRNPHIARVVPAGEGLPTIPYDLCITKDSANIDVATAYINQAVQRESQAQLAAKLLGTPVHKDITIPEAARRIVVDLDDLWFLDETYVAKHQRTWARRWTREVQS